jgi:hypothetical protein
MFELFLLVPGNRFVDNELRWEADSEGGEVELDAIRLRNLRTVPERPGGAGPELSTQLSGSLGGAVVTISGGVCSGGTGGGLGSRAFRPSAESDAFRNRNRPNRGAARDFGELGVGGLEVV